VLVDLALDYASATRLAIATAEQCRPGTLAAAVGLLQAAGFGRLALADVPGLAVMRTVCMLANEAADAVYQQVCRRRRRRSGDAPRRTSYPLGPLAWADAIGLPAGPPRAIQPGRAYGEDRYRDLPPRSHQKVFAGRKFHD
jgi:3-hydroxybutyryl-CoA dehydrogenase